jgi:hypothetical protein
LNPHSPISEANPGLQLKPVLLDHAEQRASRLQARIADTTFAGSMACVLVQLPCFVAFWGRSLCATPVEAC